MYVYFFNIILFILYYIIVFIVFAKLFLFGERKNFFRGLLFSISDFKYYFMHLLLDCRISFFR